MCRLARIGLLKSNCVSLRSSYLRGRSFSSLLEARSIAGRQPKTPCSKQNSPTGINFIERDNIAILQFHTAGSNINKISTSFFMELKKCYERFLTSDHLDSAVLISSNPYCFLAGMDILELEQMAKNNDADSVKNLSSQFQLLNHEIKNSPKPITAVVMGACLGGGLELALSCKNFIAADTKETIFGFPEVKLGLLPAGGGHVLTSRKFCNFKALQMIITGESIAAKEAYELHVIDGLVDCSELHNNFSSQSTYEYIFDYSIKHAKLFHDRESRGLSIPFPHSSRLDWWLNFCFLHHVYREFYRRIIYEKMLIRKAEEHYNHKNPAINNIYETYIAGLEQSREACYKKEQEFFSKLCRDPYSKATIALTRAKSFVKSQNKYLPETSKIDYVNVCGSGKVGTSLTQLVAEKDFRVMLSDIDENSLKNSKRTIHKNLSGLYDDMKTQKVVSNIHFDINGNKQNVAITKAKGKSTIMIDTIDEDLSKKQSLALQNSQKASKDTLLASCTSSLMINDIFKHCDESAKSNCCGIHFLMPIQSMKLIEVVPTESTSQEALSRCLAFCRSIGKFPVVVKDSPGFFVNRIFIALLSEALLILREGMSLTNMNRVSKNAGFSQGLLELIDHIGIGLSYKVFKALKSHLPQTLDLQNSSNILEEMLNFGFSGRSQNQGFFTYDANVKKKINVLRGVLPKGLTNIIEKQYRNKENVENIEVQKIISRFSKPARTEDTSDMTTELRIIARAVIETFRCLEEGLIDSPFTADVAAVYGGCFPVHLGGPCRYVYQHPNRSKFMKYCKKMESLYSGDFLLPQTLIDFPNNFKDYK